MDREVCTIYDMSIPTGTRGVNQILCLLKLTPAPVEAVGQQALSASLTLSMILGGIVYSKLMGFGEMRSRLEASVKESIAAAAGNSVDTSMITLELFPGSTIVVATIASPGVTHLSVVSAQQVEEDLQKSSKALETTVAVRINSLDGIGAVSNGPVTVDVLEVTMNTMRESAREKQDTSAEDTTSDDGLNVVVVLASALSASAVTTVLLSCLVCRLRRSLRLNRDLTQPNQGVGVVIGVPVGSPVQDVSAPNKKADIANPELSDPNPDMSAAMI